MTILVAGGCGFIGSNFINFWLETSNEKIINIDKLTYASNLKISKIKNSQYKFYKSDIKGLRI